MRSDVPADETVGYTDDGLVFFAAMARGPDGKPMNIMFSWDPNKARQIADWLIKSANEVKSKSLIIGAYG